MPRSPSLRSLTAVDVSIESRRAARRQAVFLLYQRDVTGLPIVELEGNAERDRARVLDAYTRAMVTGVLEQVESIDAAIDRGAKRLERRSHRTARAQHPARRDP